MKTAAGGKENQTQPVTAEEREQEGQEEREQERKVEGGMVDETATVEAREELGSPDPLQESHDVSHDKLQQQGTEHDQNLSQESHDGSHDVSRDLDQSGQSMEAVDLQDTHEEL